MKGTKQYRWADNPKEKEFHDKFIKKFSSGRGMDTLSGIIFGWANNAQTVPDRWLTKEEQTICVNLIQWLGSPVGQGFLRDCGFEPTKQK